MIRAILTMILFVGSVGASEYQLDYRARLNSPIKGIYLNQNTLQNTSWLQYLITKSISAGINTFVIDLETVTEAYKNNIKIVKNNNINYVARIVMFPHGGTKSTIRSKKYWQEKYKLVDAAINNGASEIQLDYIRYASSNPPSPRNAEDIHDVIRWFKEKIGNRAKLQIDVFGESVFIESQNIGQNVPKFADSIDVLCPMLYPSHFEPYKIHARDPYGIIYKSLSSLKKIMNHEIPFEVVTYIELFNYRYDFTEEQLHGYIHSQIKAIEDAGGDGWYAWSARNNYDRLFDLLNSY